MQLFSSDGSYVADVSLDEEGDLFIYPVQEGYGNIYPEAAFLRESDSILMKHKQRVMIMWKTVTREMVITREIPITGMMEKEM